MKAAPDSSGCEPTLQSIRLKLETQHEPIVLMHSDCSIARSEGFTARAKIEVEAQGRTVIATLYQVGDDLLHVHEVGLSEIVWQRLGVPDGTQVTIRHPRPRESMSGVRAKLYGHKLDAAQTRAIISDIVRERYSDVEIAAFIAAFSSQPADLTETAELTLAMVEVGERLIWPHPVIADKHSVGGLPGNRTTPLVVSIVAGATIRLRNGHSRTTRM